MAINKRSKSFSPYSYSPNYKKIGVMPNQQNKNYSNFINVPEEHYVISKKDPKFNVFVRNSFLFSYSDTCEIKFLKGESRFQILSVENKFNKEFFYNEHIFDVNKSIIYLDDFSANNNFIWLSKKSIKTKNKYDYYFDYIILENDKKYINAKITILEDLTLKFEFDHEIDRTKTKINIILFKIKEFEIESSRYDIIDVNSNEIEFDYIRKKYVFKNKFGSINVIPIVYNNNNERYNLCFDLTPSNILIDYNNINSLKLLNEKNENILKFLSNNNEEFLRSEKLDKNFNNIFNDYKNNKNEIEKFKNYNNEIDIKKCILYRCKLNKSFIIKYKINSFNIVWENNSVYINHGLGGYVKVFIDSSNIISNEYIIEYVSNDQIKIIFLENKNKEIYVNIFKI